MSSPRRAVPHAPRPAAVPARRRGSRMEIPPNQSSSARLSTPRRLQAGHAGWGWLWSWLPGATPARGVPDTVESRFSGDKIP